MKGFKSVLFIATIFSASVLFAQNNDNVFSYGNHNVTFEEFARGFNRNLPNNKTEVTQDEVNDYLNLFVNFKLKVQDALDKQMDTLPSFTNELAMYRKQISRPFLTDKSVTEHLLNEAYERTKYEVDASHILILVENFNDPADTLRAYSKMDSIRNIIISGKMNFEEAALRYSEDKSVTSNHGKLGYFTAFEMVYPFENMAYSTSVGEVSKVFRTDFGYHILKINDKRQSKGDIKVAHIMIRLNNNASEEEIDRALEKAQGIYDKIKSGEKTFEEMVSLYSEDNTTSSTGGELGWFKRTSQYPEPFKDAAFNLKNNGDVSEPVKTNFGIHIIKRIELKPLESFDEMKNSLTQKINRDSRSNQNTIAVFERISKEQNLTYNDKNLKAFKKLFKKDTDLVKGEWKYTEGKKSGNTLFEFDGIKVTEFDFAKYLESIQAPVNHIDKMDLIDKHYKDFVVYSVMSNYEDNLEDYNVEFKNQLKEYKEGILLFSLMDDMIWTKSMKDSAGLSSYFESNREKYRWNDRFDMDLYITSDKTIQKNIEKMIAKGLSNDSIVNYYKIKSPLDVSVKKGKFSKGEDKYVDMLFAKPEASKTNGNYFLSVQESNVLYVIRANKFLQEGLKELDEARGHVTSDYQSVLESEWLDSLKEKYPVKVNMDVANRLLK